MKKLNRRNFLKVTGVSSVAAVTGAGMPSAAILTAGRNKGDTLMFRAVAGMPAEPLPSFASYVIEGHVDLANRTGVITKSVFAGSPQTMSTIALPGMSRIVRITDVQDQQGILHITGKIDDHSLLAPGENPTFSALIDVSNHTASAEFFGHQVSLLLER